MKSSFNQWLDVLSEYSSINDITITIVKESIERAKVFDFLWTNSNSSDEHAEWVTDRAPAFFDILRRYAKDREKGIVQSRKFIASNTSVQVLPSLNGSIIIYPNNHPSSATASCYTLPSDGKVDEAKEDVGSNCSDSDDSTDPVKLNNTIEGGHPVPDHPVNKLVFLIGEVVEREIEKAKIDEIMEPIGG